MLAALLLSLPLARAAVDSDLVETLPEFGSIPFKMYSGILEVPGPVAGYDKLMIHYQFHTSQNDPSKDPLVTWHQGGPGGSSLFGLYTEMGYFQLGDNGNYANPNAWNKVANMLYLESPAGSSVSIGGPVVGYSSCYKNGKKQSTCFWTDVTQAEAYAHTLMRFLELYPEFKTNDLYLTGESYAGQYLPNIANYILTELPEGTLNLKGLALGNSCWGGSKNSVQCNGPNEDENDIKLFHGKGLISNKQKDAVYKACGFGTDEKDVEGLGCQLALQKAHAAVGPHNIYNLYDNCPGEANADLDPFSTLKAIRSNMPNLPPMLKGVGPSNSTGGYDWTCGADKLLPQFFKDPDVLKALHLSEMGSGFSYRRSGPASITLYPFLASKLRMLVYSGSSDACVPYVGTEESIDMLEGNGVITMSKAWHPWYVSSSKSSIPAGYATNYQTKEGGKDFTFLTIRLAGHMVPNFQPAAALDFFTRFLAGESF
mmetsp:Transcript_28612/g.55698  ORF Transcript_28612/g.55698 Transcript_28612/m.55698 type:complete len:484 (+) Transcript_28612:85-1536(+)